MNSLGREGRVDPGDGQDAVRREDRSSRTCLCPRVSQCHGTCSLRHCFSHRTSCQTNAAWLTASQVRDKTYGVVAG